MPNEEIAKTTSEKLDSILKSINDMKITQNKLINTVNLIREEKKNKTSSSGMLSVSWIAYLRISKTFSVKIKIQLVILSLDYLS